MLAGSVAAAIVGKKKPVKKDRPKLHPANALVVQTLVPLSNCCNFEEDFAASARSVVSTQRLGLNCCCEGTRQQQVKTSALYRHGHHEPRPPPSLELLSVVALRFVLSSVATIPPLGRHQCSSLVSL